MSEIKLYVAEGKLCDNSNPVTEQEAPTNWLKQAVSKGLRALVVLHLEGSPGSETVTQTAAVWYRVIKSWPIDW
ncbi:MAG: hypothetical protein WCG16_13095, partial [Methylococcales bacterium]